MTKFSVWSPIDEHCVGTFDLMTDDQVADAVAAAYASGRHWAQQSPRDRAAGLNAVAAKLRRECQLLARQSALEMGKPVSLLQDEIKFSARIFEYYAQHAEEFLRPEVLSETVTERATVVPRPIGVVLAIMPWNYPFYQVARCLAPNLLLGNAVLLKHAQQCSGTALALEKIVADSSGESGVLRALICAHDQLKPVIDDPSVQGVTLTGSEMAGRAIAEQAGRALKKVVLELGGSDPLIVLEDADLDLAVDLAVTARNQNSGQACTAAKRFVVHRKHLQDFTKKYMERISQISLSDPLSPTTTHGPLSSAVAARVLKAQVAKALDEGANLIYGNLDEVAGAWFPPMLLGGVSSRMKTNHEELFGPVGIVYSADSEKERIDIANDTPFGLGAIICTNDVRHAEEVAAQLHVGMVYINSLERSREDLPFGGVRLSGFGRELGAQGMFEFANKQLIYSRR